MNQWQPFDNQMEEMAYFHNLIAGLMLKVSELSRENDRLRNEQLLDTITKAGAKDTTKETGK